MNYTDFSNTSNNYVYPDFRPCSNSEDDFYFEFMPNKSAGINGNNSTLTSLTLSDIVIPVSEWNLETKYVNPNSVIYIQGLTKGLSYRTINYPCPSLYVANPSLPYFIETTFDISYINNFSSVTKTITSKGTYSTNKISFVDQLNIDLNNASINIRANYNKQYLTFTGIDEGFPFEISNIKINYLDASNFGINPSTFNLLMESEIPAIKYVNGAFKGILAKFIYPPYNTTISDYDKWCYIYHVPNNLVLYDISTVISDASLSYNIPESLINYNYDISLNILVDLSSNITRTPIENLTLNNEIIISVDASACTFINCIILDSSLSNNCNITDSSLSNSYMTSGILYNNIICVSSNISDISVGNSSSNISIVSSNITNSLINNLFADTCNISDSSINNIQAINSSINNSFIFTSIDNSLNKFIINSSLNESSLKDINIKNTYIINSSISGNNYIINKCILTDCSVNDNNTKNISYYIIDSSLISNNNLLNTIICNNLIQNNNSNIISYNLTEDISINEYQNINYIYDSSTKYVKNIYDISIENSCDPSVLSSTDLLNYINTNNKWFKVSELYAITGTEDRSNTNDMNKIPGFYVYNPHSFPIKLEYIIFD